MRNAQTTLALRLMPCTQCTSTRARGSCNASVMNAVTLGRCSASSANGLSLRGICKRARGIGVGGSETVPRMAETMCVMPRWRSTEGFSAVARSARYTRGTTSVGGMEVCSVGVCRRRPEGDKGDMGLEKQDDVSMGVIAARARGCIAR